MRALVVLATLGLLLGVVSVAPTAAASYGNYCNIPFVGGYVDRTCDGTFTLTYDETCWLIGWFCD